MNILGCDPGLSGGLVLLDEKRNIILKYVMPIIQVEKKNKGKFSKKSFIDLIKLNEIFEEIKMNRVDHAYLESVSSMPGQGIASSFRFGQVFGMLEATIAAHKIPYTLIHPKSWTKVLHESISKEINTKDRSLIVAKRLFPNYDLRISSRSKKWHDGLVDGVLLAEFGLRAFGK